MGFKLPKSGLPRNIAVGDRVTFDFAQSGEGEYQISTITPMAPASKAPAMPLSSDMSQDKNKGTAK